jgi:ribose transport system substrate-binding protein
MTGDKEKVVAGWRGAMRVIVGVLLALTAVVIIAGCGGGSSSSSSSTTSTEAEPSETETEPSETEPTGSEGESGAQLEKELAAAYKGNFAPFPTSAPKPKPGTNVWVISLNQGSPAPKVVAEGIESASKVLGWDTHVFDTKGSPTGASEGVRQATAAGANLIVMDIIECSVAESAIKAAKAAGITVVAVNAADCDAPNVGNEALFDDVAAPAEGGFFPFLEELAKIHTAWTLSELEGESAKILLLHQTDYVGLVQKDKEYTEQIMERCPECEVINVDFNTNDVVSEGIKGKVQAALVKNPDAKMMFFPYDATLALGGAAAIEGAGLPELKVMGGECAASTVTLIYEGVVTACVGTAYKWMGWQVMDDSLRILDEKPVEPSTVSQQLVDMEHNLPEEGKEYEGNGTNFEAEYTKLWEAAK